jgi:hypothetical protein
MLHERVAHWLLAKLLLTSWPLLITCFLLVFWGLELGGVCAVLVLGGGAGAPPRGGGGRGGGGASSGALWGGGSLDICASKQDAQAGAYWKS